MILQILFPLDSKQFLIFNFRIGLKNYYIGRLLPTGRLVLVSAHVTTNITLFMCSIHKFSTYFNKQVFLLYIMQLYVFQNFLNYISLVSFTQGDLINIRIKLFQILYIGMSEFLINFIKLRDNILILLFILTCNVNI